MVKFSEFCLPEELFLCCWLMALIIHLHVVWCKRIFLSQAGCKCMRGMIANEQSHYFLICWGEGILVILCIVNGDQISRTGVGCFLMGGRVVCKLIQRVRRWGWVWKGNVIPMWKLWFLLLRKSGQKLHFSVRRWLLIVGVLICLLRTIPEAKSITCAALHAWG